MARRSHMRKRARSWDIRTISFFLKRRNGVAFGAKISRNALCDLRLRNPSPAENTPPKKEERVFYVYIWVCGGWVVVAVVGCVWGGGGSNIFICPFTSFEEKGHQFASGIFF